MGGRKAPRYQGLLGQLLRRRRGGPWAPPPRSVQIPGDVDGSSVYSSVVVSVLSSADCLAFFCLWGWALVWFFMPFKPRPVLGFCLCPSFLCLICFVAAVFSLVFSFSQALGKPKPPLGGLGFPLCFFVQNAFAHFDPYSDLRTYTMATPRACLFFSFFAVVVALFLVLVFLGLSWWCCVSSWFVSGGGSLHAFLDNPNALVAWGRRTRHPSPQLGLLSRLLFWDWVRTGVPYIFGKMYRAGLTPPTPFLSNAVKYSPGRGWGGGLGKATVLSHSGC